jgi:hypothetical protein
MRRAKLGEFVDQLVTGVLAMLAIVIIAAWTFIITADGPGAWPGDTASASAVGAGQVSSTTRTGVTLRLAIDRRSVAPGETVTFEATLVNHRRSSVVVGWSECGFTMFGLARTVPATGPQVAQAYARPCVAGESRQHLGAGESITATLPWTVAHVDGLPAPAGPIHVEVKASFDPVETGSRIGPRYTTIAATGEVIVTALTR